jgi:hypothetical protein
MRDRHWCRREQCGSAATHRAPGAGRKGPPTSPRFCSQRRNLRNLDQCLERDRCAVSPSIRTISIASGPTAGATRMAPRRWWQRFGLICPKQSGAKRKCGLTGKIEASPSQDKPFGSGVTRRIFSLHSVHLKIPLAMCGDWRCVIHHASEDRRAANGRARRSQRIHHSIVVTSCPDIGTG